MPQTQTRVVGSGFSVLRWNGQKIAFLEGVDDRGQTPVAQPESVHPLDEPYPIEIATPRALNAGTIVITIRELWNRPVWQHLQGFENANDLLDVWVTLAAMPGSITASSIIKVPQGGAWRVKTYHGIVISAIDDTDTIAIGAMTVAKTITCLYTHATRASVSAGGA